MRGNNILVTSEPKGRFISVVLGAGVTPYAGQVLQIDPTQALQGGLPTAILATQGTNGNRTKGPLLVLLDDWNQGRPYTFQYSAGTIAKCYIPLAGDELNMLLKDVSGTGDAHTAGEMEMIETGSGKLIATTGSPQSTPFMLMETIAAPVADTWAWCIYGGN